MSASPVTQAQIVDRTRAWVRENFLYAHPHGTLGDEDPMLGNGVIDSVGVIELVGFLQEAFGLDIPDEDITERNLGSLSAVGRYVYRQTQLSGNGGNGRRHPIP